MSLSECRKQLWAIDEQIKKTYLEGNFNLNKLIDNVNNLNKTDDLTKLIIKRINMGKDIGEAKLAMDPNLKNLDRNQIMNKITYPEIEKKICDNIKLWSDDMAQLFYKFIIPKTKDKQIDTILLKNL